MKDEDAEAAPSNNLKKNNNTWLAAAKKVCELEIKKKDNTLNVLSMTEEANITQLHDDKILAHPLPTTTLNNNNITNGDECSNCNITSAQTERTWKTCIRGISHRGSLRFLSTGYDQDKRFCGSLFVDLAIISKPRRDYRCFVAGS